METKYLRCADKAYKNYTGFIGVVEFKDGLSIEKQPRLERDRMAASMAFEEVDDDGNAQAAGPAHRLVSESAARAPVAKKLLRQTDQEKANETVEMAKEFSPVPPIHSREELEAIADKDGMSGIREVAVHWNVKHRAMVVLMQMILDEQEQWLSKEENSRAAKIAQRDKELQENEPQVSDETASKLEAELNDAKPTDITSAAETGDLTAALNEPAPSEPETNQKPADEEAPAVEEKPADEETPVTELKVEDVKPAPKTREEAEAEVKKLNEEGSGKTFDDLDAEFDADDFAKDLAAVQTKPVDTKADEEVIEGDKEDPDEFLKELELLKTTKE